MDLLVVSQEIHTHLQRARAISSGKTGCISYVLLGNKIFSSVQRGAQLERRNSVLVALPEKTESFPRVKQMNPWY